MKNLRLLSLFLGLLFANDYVFAQFNNPFAHGQQENQRPSADTEEEQHNTEEGAPIGTSTVLLIALGGSTLAYKLHKNKKNK